MRGVVPIRLGDQEREQIARAAGRLEKSVSGFIREAALLASAHVEGKAVAREKTEPVEKVAFVEPEPPDVHYVDGEIVRRTRTA